ncbi:MAG TPA: xanthine dehydrogenase family protein subunit M [Acidimicrobiales bacterium]|jgi:CO/xanthine dehydrogenase FAD-binding subunit|nr:xanthine dehydrogenase family protein subunit M [Acidimicrobiales bacterium]
MTVLFPKSVEEAVAALAEPDVQVLAGGTDFMVEVNYGHRRPQAVLSLRRMPQLRHWEHLEAAEAGNLGPPREAVRLGARVTYTDFLQPELARLLPALAQAARTVGSPQIRNAGTIGGNLGTASPAGDTLPVLAALEAVVEVTGPNGQRDVPIGEFITGPKRNALQPGELIVAVRVPLVRGHQEFRKVGVRNAMVIAVASLALVVDTTTRTVRCAMGSVGPVPLRAPEAEAWLAAAIDWDGTGSHPGPDLATFGRLAAEAARPIDDHRGTAAYRRHAVAVLAERCAAAALATLDGPAQGAAA